MTTCFMAGCSQSVEYICNCSSPAVNMCLSHMGNHYALKCGQAPIHIEVSTLSPGSRSLKYLAEVRLAVLMTSNSLIKMIKSFTTKIITSIQNEESIVRSYIANASTLSKSDKDRIELRKMFNIKNSFDDLVSLSQNAINSSFGSVCQHLLLQYRQDKEFKINWAPSKIQEMNKFEVNFKCVKCNAPKIHQELFPNEPENVCSICLGTLPGAEISGFRKRSPHSPPHHGGPPDQGWPQGPPPGPPGQWPHGGKHRHGHGHGHGKEWKHKKHHSRGEMTFCPPHVRPRCEYS